MNINITVEDYSQLEKKIRDQSLLKLLVDHRNFYYDCGCNSNCMCESNANRADGEGDNMVAINLESLPESLQKIIKECPSYTEE